MIKDRTRIFKKIIYCYVYYYPCDHAVQWTRVFQSYVHSSNTSLLL